MNLCTYESVICAIQKHNGPFDFDVVLGELMHQFPGEREDSIRSILAQEYQRQIKRGFKESHSAGNKRKMYQQYKEAVERGDAEGVVVRLAREAGTSAALTARTVLEEWLSLQREEGEGRVDDKVVKQQVGRLMRDTTLLGDGRLAYEVWLATIEDHSYGPFAEAIKGSVGEEHEQKIKDILKEKDIPYCDEHVLRGQGYDKTPDIKLEIPLALEEGGHIINWIESKALFGDPESHSGYLKDQFWSYWNRFGPGMVIYWAGYVKQLDVHRAQGIVLCDHFPEKIIRYQPGGVVKKGN